MSLKPRSIGPVDTKTVNGKPAAELLAKADPLGYFDEMKTIPSMNVSSGYDDIYRTILIETPVGTRREI